MLYKFKPTDYKSMLSLIKSFKSFNHCYKSNINILHAILNKLLEFLDFTSPNEVELNPEQLSQETSKIRNISGVVISNIFSSLSSVLSVNNFFLFTFFYLFYYFFFLNFFKIYFSKKKLLAKRTNERMVGNIDKQIKLEKITKLSKIMSLPINPLTLHSTTKLRSTKTMSSTNKQ